MVYNQLTGFDPVLTLLRFAEDYGMLDGRNPYKYFRDYKDIKFDTRKFREAFRENEEVRKALFDSTHLTLESLLSRVDDKEGIIDDTDMLMDLYK